MTQIRLTPEELAALSEEVSRILFVQYKMRNSGGHYPSFGGRARLANGITRDLNIFIENLMTEKINGKTAAQERKQT